MILSLKDLTKIGFLTEVQAKFLRKSVENGLKILFSGPIYSGKTTLMRATLSEVPQTSQIVTDDPLKEITLDNVIDLGEATHLEKGSYYAFGELETCRDIQKLLEVIEKDCEGKVYATISSDTALGALDRINEIWPGDLVGDYKVFAISTFDVIVQLNYDYNSNTRTLEGIYLVTSDVNKNPVLSKVLS